MNKDNYVNIEVTYLNQNNKKIYKKSLFKNTDLFYPSIKKLCENNRIINMKVWRDKNEQR